MSAIPARLGVQQRVLPNYRAPFFDALASACPPGVSVFAGLPRPEEAIETRVELAAAQLAPARNLHLGRGSLYLCFQRGLPGWLERWLDEQIRFDADCEARVIGGILRNLSSLLGHPFQTVSDLNRYRKSLVVA